jgi:hypothetical protein
MGAHLRWDAHWQSHLKHLSRRSCGEALLFAHNHDRSYDGLYHLTFVVVFAHSGFRLDGETERVIGWDGNFAHGVAGGTNFTTC